MSLPFLPGMPVGSYSDGTSSSTYCLDRATGNLTRVDAERDECGNWRRVREFPIPTEQIQCFVDLGFRVKEEMERPHGA